MSLHLALGISRCGSPGSVVGAEVSDRKAQAAQHEGCDGCVIVLEAARCWVVWCAIETLYVCGQEDMMSGGLMH